MTAPAAAPSLDRPRRRAIEDVASALFRERGYAGTSVRDIARALEIQGASLYAHVTSKEDVLWAIVDRSARSFEEAAEATEQATRDRDPAEKVAALVRAHVAVIAADVGAAGVFVHEWRSLGAEHRESILERRDAYERRLRATIEDGMATGEFVATDPAIAAAFVLNALNGLATWFRPDGRLSAERIADHHVDLTLRALTGERD